MNWLNPALIESIGLTLLHFLWQGLLIGLLYLLVAGFWRPATAAGRYNLAVGTLLVLGLAPVLTLIHLTSSSVAPVAASGDSSVLVSLVSQAAGQANPSTLLAWTVAGWLAGVVLLSVRLLIGWHHIIRLRRSAETAAASRLKPVIVRLCEQMRIHRKVLVGVSTRVRAPVVVGWLKPLVLFPPALLNRLPNDQIEMVLAHELAHICRHDHLINLIQTVVETLLFYHPVVILISRRIRIERENACDDLAVDATRNRLAYVEMLASLEKLRHPGPRLALGVHDGQILGRIRRLVQQNRPERQRGLTLPALLMVSLTAGTAGVMMLPEPEPDTVNAVVESPRPTERAIEQPVSQPSNETAASSTSLSSNQIASAAFSLPDLDELRFQPVDVPEADPGSDPGSDRGRNPGSNRGRLESRETVAATPQPEPITTAVNSPLIEGQTLEDSGQALVSESSSDPASDSPANIAQPLELAMRLPERPEPASTTRPESTVELQPPPLTGGTLIQRVEPEFPGNARRRGTDGQVELEFTVDPDGRVRDISVVEESPQGWRFGEAATEAIAQWRFEPYRRGNDTVERLVRVEVDFDLKATCMATTGSRLSRC